MERLTCFRLATIASPCFVSFLNIYQALHLLSILPYTQTKILTYTQSNSYLFGLTFPTSLSTSLAQNKSLFTNSSSQKNTQSQFKIKAVDTKTEKYFKEILKVDDFFSYFCFFLL